MGPIREDVGIAWDPKGDSRDESILDYDQYNGRINIIEDSDPNIRFRMTEKIAIKNKATEYREAITGLQEDNLLAKVYFSAGNIQILQNGLRAGVYQMSNKKIVIPPQNIDNLKIIMRSMYLQYAKHTIGQNITDEVEKLNNYVLDYAVKSVYGEAQGYLNYCRDQSTLAMPFEHPKQVDRDFKPLEWKRFI
jgi:hypothetical protein